MNDFEKIEKRIELNLLKAEINENIKSAKNLIEQAKQNIRELEELKRVLEASGIDGVGELYNDRSCILHSAPARICNKINIKNVRIDGRIKYIAALNYIERTRNKLANS